MKKFVAVVIALAMIIGAVPAMAGDMFYGVTVIMDGVEIVSDTTYIENNTTYIEKAVLEEALGTVIHTEDEFVGLRAVCEVLGKKVEWTQETHTVTITSPVEELGGKYYVITNLGTGKALAAADFSVDNNAALVTLDLVEGDENFLWRLGKMGDMVFNLSNAVSGKSIDVPGASRDAGKGLITYTSNGNSNQSWIFTEAEEGVYTLQAGHSQLYMDASGETLVQNEKSDSDYQKWTITYVKDSILNKVVDSEGFKLLAPVLQDGFKRYMFGNLPACYTVANNAESYLVANDFENAAPQLQAEMLKTVSSYTAYGQVTGDKQNRESAKYEIVNTYVDENYDIWRGSREKVWIYEVEMEGDVEGQLHEFIMVSNEEDSAMVQKMVEGLGCFPFAVRQHVSRLIWKKGDNANNYNGGGNTIWARLNFEPSANAVIQTLAHELGHILDSNTLEDMMIWSWAETMDAIPVSSYGSSNQAEDLAEMHRLYWTTIDKDTESAVGEVYPNRLKVLKGLLYRADNTYYADFKEYADFIEEIKAEIYAYGDKDTASKLDIGKYYKVVDSETNLAWTIKDASMDNTAQLVLEEYTGADNQMFYVETGNGLVKFYNKNSDLPVQLHTSAMYNKSLTQYGGTWAVDERLQLVEAEGGYKMMSKRYNLGVTAVTEGVGDNFIPYVGQDAEGDIWIIEETGVREGVEYYTITTDGKILAADEAFGFVTEGENTSWILMPVGEDTFTIVNMATGKAVDISGGNAEAGAKLITYNLTKADNQLFYMESGEEENSYFLKMKHSELYLTVNEDGTITQEEKDSAKNQVFTFELIEDKKSVSVICKWFEENDAYKRTGISYNVDDDEESELCCSYKNGDVTGIVVFEGDNVEHVAFLPEGYTIKLVGTTNRGVLAVGCVNTAGETEVYDIVFEDGGVKLALFTEQ